MGEIADMMLDGTMDPETGEWNFDGEDGPGFPMTGAEAAKFRRATGWVRQPSVKSEGPYDGPTDYTLTKAWRKKLEAFGEVRAYDFYHWQIRRDGKVVADWWPHKRKYRIAGVTARGDERALIDALNAAAA